MSSSPLLGAAGGAASACGAVDLSREEGAGGGGGGGASNIAASAIFFLVGRLRGVPSAEAGGFSLKAFIASFTLPLAITESSSVRST